MLLNRRLVVILFGSFVLSVTLSFGQNLQAASRKSVIESLVVVSDRCERAVERCTDFYRKKIKEITNDRQVCSALRYYKACLAPLGQEQTLCSNRRIYRTLTHVIPQLIKELCGGF